MGWKEQGRKKAQEEKNEIVMKITPGVDGRRDGDGRGCTKQQGKQRRKGTREKDEEKRKRQKGDLVDDVCKTNRTVTVCCLRDLE